MQTSKRSQRLLAESKGESVSLEKPDDDEVERIGFADAYMFPVMGSCLLGGLYLIFKVSPSSPALSRRRAREERAAELTIISDPSPQPRVPSWPSSLWIAHGSTGL